MLSAPFQTLRRLLLGLLLLAGLPSEADRQRLVHSAFEHYGQAGQQAALRWMGMLEQAHAQPVTEQLEQVNAFFNDQIAFEEDAVVWGVKDYWATPLQTLVKGAGDCDDFTIAKYISLLQLGVPMERLRLTYVKAQLGGPDSSIFQAHMILSYYSSPDVEPLILDNLIDEIRPASRRSDLRPVFSFNGAGLWVGGGPNPAAQDPSARLSRWRELLARLADEGLQ